MQTSSWTLRMSSSDLRGAVWRVDQRLVHFITHHMDTTCQTVSILRPVSPVRWCSQQLKSVSELHVFLYYVPPHCLLMMKPLNGHLMFTYNNLDESLTVWPSQRTEDRSRESLSGWCREQHLLQRNKTKETNDEMWEISDGKRITSN